MAASGEVLVCFLQGSPHSSMLVLSEGNRNTSQPWAGPLVMNPCSCDSLIEETAQGGALNGVGAGWFLLQKGTER